MDGTIKHESLGRLRIHLHQCYMTLPEADQVEYWIKELAGVNRVKVYDRTAKAVASRLGLDDYCSEVLPEDKAAFIEQEHALGHTVIMVGDGINDTPALSVADVGIAITSGAPIAREVADITIAENDLQALVTLRQLCNALNQRNKHTYNFIMGFNSGLIILGMFGILQPSMTALLHNASIIGISLNCMTGLTAKEQQPSLLLS